jgi:hypothetical protein
VSFGLLSMLEGDSKVAFKILNISAVVGNVGFSCKS